LLTLVFRKIMNNKWMISCLLLGFIIVVAMVSSVPIYTDGILQRMLTKDLENFQLTSSTFPGSYRVDLSLSNSNGADEKYNNYFYFKQNIEDINIPSLDAEMLDQVHVLNVDNVKIQPVRSNLGSEGINYVKVYGMSDLEKHITLVAGRLPEPTGEEGVYEILVSEAALQAEELYLNEEYDLTYILDDIPNFRARIVGVFKASDNADPYWFNRLPFYDDAVFLPFNDFYQFFIEDDHARVLAKAWWYYALDYHKITIDELSHVANTLNAHNEFYNTYKSFTTFKMATMNIFSEYDIRAEQLTTTLWIILIPMLLMLCFYIFMVSQLIVRNDENEIAVMRSRGASTFQIFRLYLYEGLILAGIALAVGPPLGFQLCKILGAANGFLEFISRAALPIRMNATPYIYSVVAMCFFLITMLLPAFAASRQSIVDSKRKKSNRKKMPAWKKFGLDFIILGVTAYGYLQYEKMNSIISATGASGTDLSIDPLLFLLSSMFIIGAGLLCLRVYPLLIRLIFWIGKRFWSPSLYASFINVGRSSGQEQFLMLFIILSIAVGIFNANSARTLNQNAEDRIRYLNGSDIVLDVYWHSNQPISSGGELGGDSSLGVPGIGSEALYYSEPNFKQFEDLDGVASAAKVLIKDTGVVKIQKLNKSAGNVKVFGIEPSQFGKTVWFRNDLLPHHINEYLNLINGAPKGVLVSTSLRDQYDLKVGDTITLGWTGQTSVECTIYAFIDYWPGYNPYKEMKDGSIKPVDCVVANLSYLNSKMLKEPYEVWLKRADDATDTQVNESFATLDASLLDVSFSNQEIITAKNDPLLQGLNGMLTLSFIITMIVAAIGFLIYWALSIKGRALQFGIFRAMGMSLLSVIGIIIAEQIMISVVAIMIGIVLGGITSDLFVPMMQLVYNAAQQVPPFIVVASREDYMKIYTLIAAMLLIGLMTISRIISRIKIAQALKLGED